MSARRRIGIAGYMGAGKSSVARLLAARGYACVDADAEAKRLMNTDRAIQQELAGVFGTDVVRDNAVDSIILGARAFRSAENLAQLNAIVHPPLLVRLEELLAVTRGGKGVVLDAALLPMWGRTDRFDTLIWVQAPKKLRLERMLHRTRLSRDELLARMRLQESLMPEPLSPPWVFLNNEGVESQLRTALDRVIPH